MTPHDRQQAITHAKLFISALDDLLYTIIREAWTRDDIVTELKQSIDEFKKELKDIENKK